MATVTDLIEAQQSATQGMIKGKQSDHDSAEGVSFQGMLGSVAGPVTMAQSQLQHSRTSEQRETPPHSFYATQTLAQDSSDEETVTNDAVAAFRRFAKAAQDGPAALLREQYLASKGLTEDDVAAMPLEERKTLEEEIAAFIKDKMEEETGVPGQQASVSTAF
jgi:hypothetical protein